MLWYRSIEVAGQRDTIAHFFQYPNCNAIREIVRLFGADAGTPPKSERRFGGLQH